ncbi:MAG: hypothetical protein VW270_00250 [Candidatus Poseidoniales archaeon]
MPKEILGLGSAANDNTGDTLRVGGKKINDNFTEIYNALATDGANIDLDINTLKLDTLNDVDLTSTAPTNEQYLQYNGSKWVPVTHEVDGRVTGHLVPDANVTWDLGSPTHAFRDLYLSSSSLHLGSRSISVGPQGIELRDTLGRYDAVTEWQNGVSGVYANGVVIQASAGLLPEATNSGGILAPYFPGVNPLATAPCSIDEDVSLSIEYRNADGGLKTFSNLRWDLASTGLASNSDGHTEDYMFLQNPGSILVSNHAPDVIGIAEEIRNAVAVTIVLTKKFVPEETEEEVAEEIADAEVVVDTSDITLLSHHGIGADIFNGNWDFDSLDQYEISEIGGVDTEHLPGLDVSDFVDALTANFVDTLASFEAGIEATFTVTKTNGTDVVYKVIPNHQKDDASASGFIVTGFKTIQLKGDALTEYNACASYKFEIVQKQTDTKASGSIIPDTDVAYDLGSPTHRFRDLYISGSSIHFGNQKISDEGGQIRLSAPLAPYTEEEQQVFQTTDQFSSSHPKQITFKDRLPGAKMDIPNMRTTIEDDYVYKLKIEVPDGTITPLADYEAEVVNRRQLQNTGNLQMYRTGRYDIKFFNTPSILGVVETDRRNPEKRFVGFDTGYYGEIILRSSDGDDQIERTLDSAQNYKGSGGTQFELSGGPSDGVWMDFDQKNKYCVRITFTLPDGTTQVAHNRNSPYLNLTSGHQGGDFVFTPISGGTDYRFWLYNETDADGNAQTQNQWVDVHNQIKNAGYTYVENGVTKPRIKVEFIIIAQTEEIRISKYHPMTGMMPVEKVDYFQFTSKNSLRIIPSRYPGWHSKAEKAMLDQALGKRKLTLKLITNKQERKTYELELASRTYDARKPVSVQMADQMGEDKFLVLSDRTIEVLNPDIYNKYKGPYGRRPFGWFDKKASLEFTITKIDTSRKGDVLTTEGVQNIENKVLGKDGSPTEIDGSFIPKRDLSYDLGSPTHRFRDLYISSDSMHIGGTKLSTAGGSLKTFDIIYRNPFAVHNSAQANASQFDGNPARFATAGYAITPLNNYVETAPHHTMKFMKDFSAKLIADVRKPVQIVKKYPDFSVSEEVNRNFTSAPNPTGLAAWRPMVQDNETSMTVYKGAALHVLEITLFELEATKKWKIQYKFTGNSSHTSEWLIEKRAGYSQYEYDVLAIPQSTLVKLDLLEKVKVMFKYVKADGTLDPNVKLMIDSADDVAYLNSNSLSPASGLTSIGYGDTPVDVYGATLLMASQHVSTSDNSLGMELRGFSQPFYPKFKPQSIAVSLEHDSNFGYLRLYALRNFNDESSIEYGRFGSNANTVFLTEFKFSDWSNPNSVLQPTEFTRPIDADTFDHSQQIVFKQFGSTSWGTDAKLTWRRNTSELGINERSDTAGADPWYDFMLNKNGYCYIRFPANAPMGPLHSDNHFKIPNPLLLGSKQVIPNTKVEINYQVDSTWRNANNFLLFNASGLEQINLDQFPYKLNPNGSEGQRFKDGFELQIRLYNKNEEVTNDAPAKIYRQLSTKDYRFEMTGALEHNEKDYNTEGIIVDNIGNLTIKGKDYHTVLNDFTRATAIRIALVAQPGIREFTNWSNDIEATIANKQSLLYVQSEKSIYVENAKEIGPDCDIATIVANADKLEIEIAREVKDPAVSSIQQNLANTTNNFNQSLANTSNQLSTSIANTQSQLSQTNATLATTQSELMKALKIQSSMAVPTSNTAAGTMGDMVIDGNMVYIAVADNKWGRITLDFNF